MIFSLSTVRFRFHQKSKRSRYFTANRICGVWLAEHDMSSVQYYRKPIIGSLTLPIRLMNTMSEYKYYTNITNSEVLIFQTCYHFYSHK